VIFFLNEIHIYMKKMNWRRAFSHELTPADYACEDVWITKTKCKLVKFKSRYGQEGKWCVFSAEESFLGRIASKTPPLNWATTLVIEFQKE